MRLNAYGNGPPTNTLDIAVVQEGTKNVSIGHTPHGRRCSVSDDLASTLKWWVEHANTLEKERDRWKKIADTFVFSIRDHSDDPTVMLQMQAAALLEWGDLTHG